MCGIVGLNWEDAKLISRCTQLIKHRGPDDSGTFVDKVSLGNVRLSIMDLSKKGHMPMTRDNRVITFNGEIYNFKEIREELKKIGYKFTSDSDTEVVLLAYDAWGTKCLDKFNGMFAFCIYDKKKQEFFIVRDRFGIKPLYFINKNKKFGFCSEIKGLLDLLSKKEVDKDGLKQFFTFRFTLGETTLLKDVKRFLPGHYMIYDTKTRKIKKYEKYYELKKQAIENKDYEFYKEELREKLIVAVDRRMVADVPVATFLSGGIDSSLITSLAKRQNPKLNTFSIGFDINNELKYAKKVSKQLKTNHKEYKLNKDKVLSYLDEMVYHMDEPVGDLGYLPIFVLSKEVKKHNKVVLSGDGADEILCGYDRYKLFKHGKFLRNFIFYDFGNDVLKRIKNMKGKDDYGSFFEIIRLFDDEELKELKVGKYNGKKVWKNNYKGVANAQEFDVNVTMPYDLLMKADKMSCAFGLEERVPYFDHEVVEFAFSIPQKYKLKFWNEKKILKEISKDYLPSEIINRRKMGFAIPVDYWFKNVLGDKLRKLLDKSKHNLYDKNLVYKLLDEIKRRGNNYKSNTFIAQKLWSILLFEMWYERFVG